MELRQLTYFVAVAEELHFGRAAARVHIAQPALSTQIQSLERELGVQLFVRTTRRVELTVAGEAFYDRCVRILSDIDLSAEVTRSIAGKTVRKIRIGTIYPATIGVLPAFLSKIARKYPDIQLQVQSGSTGDIIRNLESGQVNLGFIRPVENIGSLRFFSMANGEYLLAVAKDSRLAGLDETGIEDLRNQKIISFSRQNLSYTERYFAEMFAEHNLARNIAYRCDDIFALVSLVSAGLGIGFAPQWTKQFRTSQGEGRGLQDRHGGGLEQRGSDSRAGRHHRHSPLAGQAAQTFCSRTFALIRPIDRAAAKTPGTARRSSNQVRRGRRRCRAIPSGRRDRKQGVSSPIKAIRPRTPSSSRHTLYGTEVATAVAYCGLDAWFEGEEGEFRRFAQMFRRLKN